MASFRCLSINETSIYSIRARARSTSTLRAANHHYWAVQAGKPYGGSNLYKRNTYYAQLNAQRHSRYSRPCGSWSRRYREVPDKEKADQESVKSKSGIKQDLKDDAKHPRRLFDTDHFFSLLKNDSSQAYKYLQQELEKDPYRWMFDPKGTNSAWNAVEWWNKRRQFFNRQRAWHEEPSSDNAEDIPNVAKTHSAPVVEAEEEFRIDPITMRKVPIVRNAERDNEQEGLYPKYQSSPMASEHTIPIKKYQQNVVNSIKPPPVEVLSRSKGDTKLSGFANQAWLVKEGFAVQNNEPTKTQQPIVEAPPSKETVTRIQPSLDRMIDEKARNKTTLNYPPKEVTADDVDLLQASDIRAASGRVKKMAVPSENAIKERSEALEKNWNEKESAWTKDVMKTYDELLEKRKASLRIQENATDRNGDSKLKIFQKVKQIHNDLQQEVEATTAMLEKYRAHTLQDLLSKETTSVKQNFDGFEQRSRKHVLASDIQQVPKHKSSESDISKFDIAAQQKKLQQLERDAELVNKIREIYEQKYGKITLDHKQKIMESENSNHPDLASSKTREPAEIPIQRNSSLKNSISVPVGVSGSSFSPKGASVRDILNQRIETLDISEQLQKRLKFAIRGLPELDISISTDRANTSKDTTFSNEPSPIPQPSQPIRNVAEDKKRKSKELLEPKETSTSISSENKQSKSKLQYHDRNQHPDHTHSKKVEEYTYMYKILALDNAKKEVAVATTTSSIKHKSSVPRSAAGLLVHLDQPAKYFSHMESLDAKGFQLVSGSRTMLVYRRKIVSENSVVDKAPVEGQTFRKSRSMNPLREEPVFSGHLKPKERLLRSYQLAHRRAESAVEPLQPIVKPSSGNDTDRSKDKVQDQSPKPKASRNLGSTFVTVVLVITLCYTIGLLRSIREKREYEEGVRLRKEEAALRKVEARKQEWNWF